MIVTSAKTCVAPVATSRVGGNRAAGTKSTMRPSLARVTLSRRASAVAVSAGKKAPEMPPIVSPTDGTPEWFACVACADFYFNDIQNEALAEQADDPKRHDIEELSNPEGPHIEMVRTAVPCARFACMAHTQRCLPSVAESRMRRAGGSAHGSRRPDGRADRRAAAAHATNGRGGSCRASRSRPGK